MTDSTTHSDNNIITATYRNVKRTRQNNKYKNSNRSCTFIVDLAKNEFFLFFLLTIGRGCGITLLHEKEVSIVDCDIHDLDLDIGAGKFELSGVLNDDCRIDMGAGNTEIQLVGTLDDYCFDVHKGIGNIRIDGNEVSNNQNIGGGDCRVRISGGVGSADITFK